MTPPKGAATPETRQQRFWNRLADRYAARPIKDVAAYEALLSDAASRLRPTDHVLEIGCGTGGSAIRLASGVASYKATDFSTQMIRIASAKPAPPNLRFEVVAAESAFDDGPFDAICAFNVLHLVDDLPALLARIQANLRPGGLLICKTWCFAELPARLRALFVLLRLVGLFPAATWLKGPDLREAIRAAGFDIEADLVFGSRSQNPYIIARKTMLSNPSTKSESPRTEG